MRKDFVRLPVYVIICKKRGTYFFLLLLNGSYTTYCQALVKYPIRRRFSSRLKSYSND